jgi:hypothetical protein
VATLPPGSVFFGIICGASNDQCFVTTHCGSEGGESNDTICEWVRKVHFGRPKSFPTHFSQTCHILAAPNHAIQTLVDQLDPYACCRLLSHRGCKRTRGGGGAHNQRLKRTAKEEVVGKKQRNSNEGVLTITSPGF